MSGKRNRRAGVEDRWTKTVRDEHGNTQTVPSAANGKGKRWRARYVDERGRSTRRDSRGKLTRRRAWTNRPRPSCRLPMSRRATQTLRSLNGPGRG